MHGNNRTAGGCTVLAAPKSALDADASKVTFASTDPPSEMPPDKLPVALLKAPVKEPLGDELEAKGPAPVMFGHKRASPSFGHLGYPRSLLAAETSTTIAAIGIATFTRRNFFRERATISTEIGEGFGVRIAYPPRKRQGPFRWRGLGLCLCWQYHMALSWRQTPPILMAAPRRR